MYGSYSYLNRGVSRHKVDLGGETAVTSCLKKAAGVEKTRRRTIVT